MPESWDVVVVGAGPAGATAALAACRARPGSRVLLLDRADFPRDKPCGDGVAPHVLDVLEALGAGDLLADRVSLTRLELGLGSVRVAGAMHRPAHVVPRTVLDARLVQAAQEAGAVLRRHRVRRVVRHADAVVLDEAVTAPVVVAADGAHSVFGPGVHGRTGWAHRPRTALALRGYAPTHQRHRGAQVIRFGRTRQPSYAWSFDRGDGWSNVGYGELLRHRSRPPTRALMLDQLEALLPGAGEGGRDWRAHHLPLSGPRFAQPPGRVLLVGDAARLINPLTGEGLFYAVLTGASAGAVAAGAGTAPGTDPGREHRRRVAHELRAHLLTTTLVSRLVQVPGLLGAGLRAADRDAGVFDDLVEIGLGAGVLTPRLLQGLARHLVR